MNKLIILFFWAMLVSAFAQGNTAVSRSTSIPFDVVNGSFGMPSGTTLTIHSGATLDVTGATLIGFPFAPTGPYLPLTGGTVTGETSFTGGLASTNNFSLQPGSAIIFVGDSITAGVTLSSPSTQAFPALFSNDTFAHGHGVYQNLGASGYQISDLVTQYSGSVYPHRPTANGGDGGPQSFLFVLIGTNNIAIAGQSASTVITALSGYITQAQSDGFTVIVSTITPRGIYGGQVWGPTQENARLSVNYAIRNRTVPSNIVVDYCTPVPDWSDTTVYTDQLHPAATGHQFIEHYLNQRMSSLSAVPSNPYVTDGPFQAPTAVIGSTNPQSTYNVLYVGNKNVAGGTTTPTQIQMDSTFANNVTPGTAADIKFTLYSTSNNTQTQYGIGVSGNRSGTMEFIEESGFGYNWWNNNTELAYLNGQTGRLSIFLSGLDAVGLQDTTPGHANAVVLGTDGSGNIIPITSGTLPAFNGSALTSLNGSNISSGTVADARLSANIPLLNANNTFSGENIFSDGIMGIGTSSPSFPASRNGVTIRDLTGNGAELIIQSSSATDGTANGFALVGIGTNAGIFNRLSGTLGIGTNNATQMIFNSDGSVSLSTAFTGSSTGTFTGFIATAKPTGTLSSGTCTITNAAILATSAIAACHLATSATNAGALYVSALSAGSVTIKSVNPLDNDTIVLNIQ